MEYPRDLRIAAAQQVDDLDRVAIAPQCIPRGQPHGRRAGEGKEADQSERHPAERRQGIEDRRQPLRLRIDPGSGCRIRQQAAQPVQRGGIGAVPQPQVDQRGQRHRLFRIVSAQPRFEQIRNAFGRDDRQPSDRGVLDQQGGRCIGLLRARLRVGIDDLHGCAARQFAARPIGEIGERKSATCGKHRKGNHDGDHPRHRPTQPRLGQEMRGAASAKR